MSPREIAWVETRKAAILKAADSLQGENPMSVYQSLADFYKRRGGRHSPESDYGAQNYLDKTRVPGDTWRVSHVEETGDFYAVRHRWNSDNIVLLLGRVPKELSEREVHHLFSDWADSETPGRPLYWFRERIEDVRLALLMKPA